MTMAGGALAETHANRRTDYAMVTDSDADLANAADYPAFLERMGDVFAELAPRAARRVATRWSSSATPTRTGATCSPARTSRARAAAVGLVPKGDLIWYQAGTRLRPYGYPRAFVPNIVHQHILVLRKEPVASGVAAARLEVGLEHVAVDVRLAHRPACRRRSASWPSAARWPAPSSASTTSPRVILWSQPCWPSGRQDQPVRAVLLEQLDLVALVEVADLGAAQLVGRVEQADDAVADDPPLATGERADEALVEGQARGRRGVADRIGLARLEQRRAAPARHEHLQVDSVSGATATPPGPSPMAS